MHKDKLPRHVAIIMDGNGRWARKKGLPNIFGHRAGVKAVRRVTECARETGIKVLTLYAFSTENWLRSKTEIKGLMGILEKNLEKEKDTFMKNDVKFNFIGNVEKFPLSTKKKLNDMVELTKDNKHLLLNLALGYGGREEILQAARDISLDVKDGRLKVEDLDEKTFSRYLYTKNMPDPDLLIRTSGEMRISNFLLWQVSYAEIYVTEKFWPDFTKEDFKKAIEIFTKRERRFGK